MDLDLRREIGQQFLQPQSDLFRGRTDIGKNEDRLPAANQLRQLCIKSHASVARRRIRFPANGRKNLHERFFLNLRFSDPALASFTD